MNDRELILWVGCMAGAWGVFATFTMTMAAMELAGVVATWWRKRREARASKAKQKVAR